MDVSYQLTPKDFAQVIRQRREWKRERSWLSADLLWLLILVCIVVAILVVGREWSPANLGFAILLPPGIFMILVIARMVRTNSMARKQFETEPSAQSAISLYVSSDGLSFRSAASDSSANWNYLKWREGKHQFVLFLTPETYIIVPKRAFTPGQLKELSAAVYSPQKVV